MDYIYGKLNYEIQKVEYTGVVTETATTSVNNVARTISVNVTAGIPGPTGPTGPQGIQGIQGIQGPIGPPGEGSVTGIFDNTHYRIASDGNSFNANDNTKFFFGLERTITINSVTYTGSIFQFTNNFFQFEDFIITRNGTFTAPLNQNNTTTVVVGTVIFNPSGAGNWETSEAGNHRITLIITNSDPASANTNRTVVIEKI